MINKQEAITKVADALAKAKYHNECSGGYGIADMSASETLAAIFGGFWSDYEDTLNALAKEAYNKNYK